MYSVSLKAWVVLVFAFFVAGTVLFAQYEEIDVVEECLAEGKRPI